MLKTTTIGDLSRNFGLQRQTATLKQTLERLGYEVTTGRTTDIAKSVGGDFLPISSIEASISLMARRIATLSETQAFVETGQRALETIQDRALNTGANLITVSSSAEVTVVEAVTSDARQGLAAIISAFNTQVGGRGIFGGMATNLPALADADIMMADIDLAVAGATTAQDVITAIDAWFDDPGGGFETLGYIGSPNRLLPFDLGLGERANFDFAADDGEARGILKGFALASVLDSGSALLPSSERQALVRYAGERLLTAEKDFAEYRAQVGTIEAAIATASTRNSNEMAALELTRAGILGIDQYAAAGQLQATQVQLEMLYTLTARMSRLNLMEYLR